MPVVEIATFPASQLLLDDPNAFKPALDFLCKVPGSIGVYSGFQVENPKLVYLVVVWETYEHHKQSMEVPNHVELIEKSKPVIGGPIKMHHIPFDPDATTALESPTTEFATAKLKTGDVREEFDVTVASLLKKLGAGEGCYSPTVAESREESGTLVIAIGWDSPQVHADAVEGDANVKKLFTLSDLEVVHVNLKKNIV